MMRHSTRGAVIAAALAGFAVATGAVADDQAQREERWKDIRQSVFGERAVDQGDLISIDAPKRAEDASLVPIGIKLSKPDEVKSTTIFIDSNPSPLAAKVTFGPAADPSLMKFRMRVDAYSDVRAVAETTDGKLVANSVFLKASGGCSAPAGASVEEALQGVGEMRFKVRDEITPGKPAQATLMIRHPNFNGMQMDQIKRTYTPARYIKDIKVTYNDRDVFNLVSDITLSTNPVIEFGFKPEAQGKIKVSAVDTSGASWEKTFDVPSQSN